MNKLIIFCSALFLLGSCKKKVDELPPATQTGAHTFGAKVNGQMWVPRGFGAFPANDVLEARLFSNGDLIINARDFSSTPTETEFHIFVQGVTAPGVYPLNSDVTHPGFTASYAYYVKRRLTPENEWMTSAAYSGSVTITRIDAVNRIASGTFQFNMLNIDNAPQPMSVTEGRFDVRIQ